MTADGGGTGIEAGNRAMAVGTSSHEADDMRAAPEADHLRAGAKTEVADLRAGTEAEAAILRIGPEAGGVW